MISSQTDAVVVMQDGRDWWRFDGLERIIVASSADEIKPALLDIEAAVDGEGLYATGYMAYEAAAAFGLATHPPLKAQPPLMWFGLFRQREPVELLAPSADFRLGTWRPSLDQTTYYRAIEAIKAQIAAGYTYQANFTFSLQASFDGDPWAFFTTVARAQRGGCSAYIDIGSHVICSVSPELFFELDGERIVSRPMKGTAGRGLSSAADEAQVNWLRQSEKNRAENVMIVDMIRNDIGRVADVGSVSVPSLLSVERYPTLLQMTSTVEATTSAPLNSIISALFPCASITGAPKVRTMRILRELEAGPRGIYTGAIGYVLPGRIARFSVAIRTAVIDRATSEATYGVGSGVVWDSDAAAEYAECLLKARVLDAKPEDGTPFSLIESLRWTPEGGYTLLEQHMARLAASAAYFVFPLNAGEVLAQLNELARTLSEPSKVRLLLDQDGRLTAVAETLAAGARPEPVRIGLARFPVDSSDRFLYHKTTRREVYEAAKASRPDCDDVVLWNERGELTEATASNIVLELGGEMLTPPVSAGLLPGTFRQELLERGEIIERPLNLDDLQRAGQITLINSVRLRQRGEFTG